MSTLDLQTQAGGTLLAVRARAGGKINGVTGIRQGAVQLSVTQVAEKGKANEAIVAVLAKVLKCSKGRVQLVRGATSPTKQFLIADLSSADVEARIKQAVPD